MNSSFTKKITLLYQKLPENELILCGKNIKNDNRYILIVRFRIGNYIKIKLKYYFLGFYGNSDIERIINF